MSAPYEDEVERARLSLGTLSVSTQVMLLTQANAEAKAWADREERARVMRHRLANPQDYDLNNISRRKMVDAKGDIFRYGGVLAAWLKYRASKKTPWVKDWKMFKNAKTRIRSERLAEMEAEGIWWFGPRQDGNSEDEDEYVGFVAPVPRDAYLAMSPSRSQSQVSVFECLSICMSERLCLLVYVSMELLRLLLGLLLGLLLRCPLRGCLSFRSFVIPPVWKRIS